MVVDHASFKAQATGQQVGDITVPAPRGAILDRNGDELAVSTDAADVSATPVPRQGRAEGQRAARAAARSDAEQIAAKLADRKSGFVYLARSVPGRVVAKIAKLEIEGIDTTPTTKRAYPGKTMASQVLGFVGTEGKGLSGLEYRWEKQLHGSDGERRVVKDGAGDAISTVDVAKVQPGENLELTLDSQLQLQTESVLKQVAANYSPKGASAIVMDPRDGSVLAMANYPTLDANDPGAAEPEALQNRAVGFNYEPGSTFKAVTVGGALSDKKVTPSTMFDLPVNLQVEDRVIKDADDRGPMALPVSADHRAVVQRRNGQDRADDDRQALRPVGAQVRIRTADRHRPRGRGAGARARRTRSTRASRRRTSRSARGFRRDADPDGGRLLGDRQRRHPAPAAHR